MHVIVEITEGNHKCQAVPLNSELEHHQTSGVPSPTPTPARNMSSRASSKSLSVLPQRCDCRLWGLRDLWLGVGFVVSVSQVGQEWVAKTGAHTDCLPINLGLELLALLRPADFLPAQPVDERGGCLHLLPAHVGIVEQVLHSGMRNVSDNMVKLSGRDMSCPGIKLRGGISQLAK